MNLRKRKPTKNISKETAKLSKRVCGGRVSGRSIRGLATVARGARQRNGSN